MRADVRAGTGDRRTPEEEEEEVLGRTLRAEVLQEDHRRVVRAEAAAGAAGVPPVQGVRAVRAVRVAGAGEAVDDRSRSSQIFASSINVWRHIRTMS